MTTSANSRVVGFAGTDEEAEELRRWAFAFGHRVIGIERKYSSAMKMLRDGQADALLVGSLHAVEDLEPFARGTWRLMSVSEMLDSKAVTGQVYLQQWLNFRGIRSDPGPLQVAGISEPGAQDGPTGRVPYGYRIVGGKLVKHTYEQKVIARAVELNAQGVSKNQIARLLNQEGFRSRRNTEFSAQQVIRMLGEKG